MSYGLYHEDIFKIKYVNPGVIINKTKEIITVFIGNDVTDTEKERFEEAVSVTFPDQELVIYDGGQDVYSFLIALE